ncbi:hypothetical protein [Thiomicrorhabdus sediminis]|uniref:Uncharacterized protein n=1 Tax=Thiomicrorhabdus sediminis TaxID=2580412 RepID=A0A4P9K5J6_9GAMM|nr:hypothetical protein [Thiomicrorhabdus sediminis]QCU90128.1 hypothetical protein FE785_05525 [Thiomicrorhabdus sediminis]
MSAKTEAMKIIEQLDDKASWNDIIKAFYLERKLTIGLSKDEINREQLTESEVNGILARLESASDMPSDMLNTKEYNPGNATTLGMVSGVIAILFAFIFPPITWVAAAVALVSGLVGLKRKEEKYWVGILLALISILPMLSLWV